MVEALEIKISRQFNFRFLTAILFYQVSPYFLIVDLYVLIPSVTANVFSPNAEIIMLTGTPCKEAKAEVETYPVTAEDKISKCSIQFKVLQTFLFLLVINSFCFIFSDPLFHLYFFDLNSLLRVSSFIFSK